MYGFKILNPYTKDFYHNLHLSPLLRIWLYAIWQPNLPYVPMLYALCSLPKC